MHGFVENEEEPCKYKWVNSFTSVFLILYVNKIFLIKNDIPYITKNKDFTIIIVLRKGLEKGISHPMNRLLLGLIFLVWPYTDVPA